MKLLLDQNLSRRIPDKIVDLFPGSAHIVTLGMETATDGEIWEFARQQGFTILSKDADFLFLALTRGHPPQVIHVDLGNCTTLKIVTVLRGAFPQISQFIQHQEESLLTLIH